MNIQELEREHEHALAELRTLASRNVDPATMTAAADRLGASHQRLQNARNQGTFQSAIDRATAGMNTPGYGGSNSPGAQFIHGEPGRWLKDTKNRPQHWETPALELIMPGFGGMMATTITSDPSGGGLLVPPQFLPGAVPVPLRPAVVADLLGAGPTTSNSIHYQREVSFTVAAAAVTEAGLKPESTIVFEPVVEPVNKLAHFLPITDELLEDLPSAGAYINSRLIAGLMVLEDDQLLSGNGTQPNLLGLLARPGLAPPIPRVDPVTNADAIALQISAIQSTTFRTPTGIVMHPKNFESIVLSKNTLGSYIGASPFQLPLVPSLWGKPVAVTTACPLGSALIVTQSEAMVLRRGGVIIKASNSHADYFIRNLTAIVCEERLALAVFRPACFGLVTGLN